MKNIMEICVNTEDMPKNKLEKVIEILRAGGATTWEDATEYFAISGVNTGATGISFIENADGYYDLDGRRNKKFDGELVSFDEWYETFMAFFCGETTLRCIGNNSGTRFTVGELYPVERMDGQYYLITDNRGNEISVPLDGMLWQFEIASASVAPPSKNPKPRYRRKRQAVAKRTATKVVVEYKDGKSYTLKGVTKIGFSERQVRITRSTEVVEGISEHLVQVIDPTLVQAVLIITPNKQAQLTQNAHLRWTQLVDNGDNIENAESIWLNLD